MRLWDLSTRRAREIAAAPRRREFDRSSSVPPAGQSPPRVRDGTVRVCEPDGRTPCRRTAIRGPRGGLAESARTDPLLAAVRPGGPSRRILWALRRRGGAAPLLAVHLSGHRRGGVQPRRRPNSPGAPLTSARCLFLERVRPSAGRRPWGVTGRACAGRPSARTARQRGERRARRDDEGVGSHPARLRRRRRLGDSRAPRARGRTPPSSSPDGLRALSAGNDGTAREWEWGGGLVASIGIPLRADSIPIGPPAFSGDGSRSTACWVTGACSPGLPKAGRWRPPAGRWSGRSRSPLWRSPTDRGGSSAGRAW